MGCETGRRGRDFPTIVSAAPWKPQHSETGGKPAARGQGGLAAGREALGGWGAGSLMQRASFCKSLDLRYKLEQTINTQRYYTNVTNTNSVREGSAVSQEASVVTFCNSYEVNTGYLLSKIMLYWFWRLDGDVLAYLE